ncbi:MAG: DUF554 domain-containing protein [Oscillospiraceae bacterium]|nr:DUF554 domain-containing protein [Oscillospiraceae bacterium]
MIGVIVNTVAVLAGSAIGLLLKKGIPEKLTSSVMLGIGLSTLYLGWSGTLKGQNALVLILSMAVGALIGSAADIDSRFTAFVESMENRFNKGGSSVSIAEGFITASLLFCVGAMTIVGSLQSGLTGDHEMIMSKSVLDFISAIILSSTLGIGVLLSAVFVFIFQGTIVLLAQIVAPILTEYVIAEMTCAGSLLIFALGLNIVGITKIKVMNYLPAVFLPIVLCLFM